MDIRLLMFEDEVVMQCVLDIDDAFAVFKNHIYQLYIYCLTGENTTDLL
jgi:hypothetical protein